MRCINYLSEYLVPVVLFYIVGFAVLQKRPVFDDFIEGALAGLKTVAGILPTLVGLMAAVGVLRTSVFSISSPGCWRDRRHFCIYRHRWFRCFWCVWCPVRRRRGCS